jgi:hypothetical protein
MRSLCHHDLARVICHAEGRGFESLHPLQSKAPLRRGFLMSRVARSSSRMVTATSRTSKTTRRKSCFTAPPACGESSARSSRRSRAARSPSSGRPVALVRCLAEDLRVEKSNAVRGLSASPINGDEHAPFIQVRARGYTVGNGRARAAGRPGALSFGDHGKSSAATLCDQRRSRRPQTPP